MDVKDLAISIMTMSIDVDAKYPFIKSEIKRKKKFELMKF